MLAHHTGQDVETIKRDTDRDFFMSGEEAKDYGIIDEVIVSKDGQEAGGKAKASEGEGETKS